MNGMDADADADVTTRVCRFLNPNELEGTLYTRYCTRKDGPCTRPSQWRV